MRKENEVLTKQIKIKQKWKFFPALGIMLLRV